MQDSILNVWRTGRGVDMYRIDDENTYLMMLPPNMQDTDAECFSYALSKQMHRFIEMAEKLNLWGNLKNADPRYYDYIAACMRVPYYRSEFSDDVKLKLICHGYEIYRYAGTRAGVKDLINIIFDKAVYINWDEYEGEQYHFKVLVYDVLKEDAATMLTNVIQKVKAARSVMDSIEIGREAFGISKKGAAVHSDVAQVRIKEDNCDTSTVKGKNCIGATAYASIRAVRIQEDNSRKNTIIQTVHTGASQHQRTKTAEREDNSLSNSAGTTLYLGKETRGGEQKNEKIKEDMNDSNETETTMHMAAEQKNSTDSIRIK